MSQLQERIDRMRKMASDDPDNEIGHYSLGRLLAEDGQHDEAIKSFCRTLEISPHFSKVYELLGESLLKVNRRDEAIEVLQNGWKIAGERGDRLPREAMAKMLKNLGVPVEESPVETADLGPGTGFRCQRPMCNSGGQARQLPGPPLPDAVGQAIFEKICASCWNEWFRNYSIKVINELRIDLSTEFGQREYDKYMREFFGWEEAPAAA